MRVTRGLHLVVLLGIGMACGGGSDGDGGGGGGPDVSIAKSGAPNGDAQTGVVATAVIDSLRVLVQEDGVPQSGVTVTWTAQGAGAAVSPATSITDAGGLAATRLTLGTAAVAQTARATLAGATGSPVTFNATATAGPATSFTATAGNGQTTTASTAFATPLSVKVADQHGNGIVGVTVTWTVQSGTVTLSGGATSVTAASGVASKSVTASATIGAALVRATNPSVAGDLDFTLMTTAVPVAVSLGSTFFQSDRNGTSDPAVDTTTVGRPVVWSNTSGTHTVASTGSPSFTSSGNLSGNGSSYTITFNTVGTYQYECGIHGDQMTGRIVVQP